MAHVYRKSRLAQQAGAADGALYCRASEDGSRSGLASIRRPRRSTFAVCARSLRASEDQASLSSEIEADESYFGGSRKGKRVAKGAAGKIPAFGLLKRGGKVDARIIPDVKSRTLQPILQRKIVPDSIVYSDTLKFLQRA